MNAEQDGPKQKTTLAKYIGSLPQLSVCDSSVFL
eukprot:SAG11_NODE_1390_length_5055_cov_2.299637_3_plen_34_part_00